MRTLILVLALLALALATGASFVAKAQKVGGAATLEGRCDPSSIPADVDTLVRCTFTARNTGAVRLDGARLQFQPGNGSAPDAYYFFAASLDGTPLSVAPSTLDYGFGDLSPGATSTLDISVIVRSSHPYGASAVLIAAPDATEYARAQLGGTLDASPPRLIAGLEPAPSWSMEGTPGVLFAINLDNHTGQMITALHLETASGASILPYAGDADTRFAFWSPGRQEGHATMDLGGALPDGSHGSLDNLYFPPDANEPCAYVRPAVVITVTTDGGEHLTAAAIATEGANVDDGCGDIGGGVAKGLPGTGDGASRASGGDTVHRVLLVLALGGFLVGAGLSVRRARRR